MLQELVTAVEQLSSAIAIIITVVLVVSVARIRSKQEKEEFLIFLRKGMTAFTIFIAMKSVLSFLAQAMWWKALLSCLTLLLLCKNPIQKVCQKRRTKQKRRKQKYKVVIEN